MMSADFGATVTLSYQPTPADFADYSLYASRRRMLRNPGVVLRLFLALVLGLCFVLVALYVVAAQESAAPIIRAGAYTDLVYVGVLAAFALLAVLCVLLSAFRLQKKAAAVQISDDGPMSRPTSLRLIPEGVHVQSDYIESIFHWPAIQSVETSKGAVYLLVDGSIAIIVPKSAFASKSDRDDFMALLASMMEQRAR